MDNYNFDLTSIFRGYVSSIDPTNTVQGVLVRGSQNVYKKNSGTIANRPGLLRRGTPDGTLSGIVSAYTWESSLGREYPMRVTSDGRLQFESSIVDGHTLVWYTLLSGLSLTRFVFDDYWDNSQKKSRLIMVNGDSVNQIKHWSGGVTLLGYYSTSIINATGNNTAITSFALANSNQSSIYSTQNGLAGTSASGDIVLKANPTAGDTLVLTINGVPLTVHFVSTIGAAAGNVLVGANLAATQASLLNLLQNPGVTNATQVAFASGDQTLISYFLWVVTSGLVKANTATSWAQDGFNLSNSVVGSITYQELFLTINGNNYSYTGGADTTVLRGISPSPAGEAANSVVIQPVSVNVLNVPAAGFAADFIRVVGNRAYVGSYQSRIVYISSNVDFRNYTVPTPQQVGDPSFAILDSNASGVGIRNGDAYVSGGNSDWYPITFTQQTVGTQIVEITNRGKEQTGSLTSAYAHEFIDMVGDDMVFLAKDQQLRTYGTFRNLVTSKYPSYSQAVLEDFKYENFKGGHLIAIDDFIYITAPANGRDWMLQTRQSVDPQGNVVSERLWHPPQIRNVSRFTVINGTLYGHSNANPQVYQIWDTEQWHDDSPSGEPLAYQCVMTMSYGHISTKGGGLRRQGMATLSKVYYEGYMANGSIVYGNLYSDYQGSSGLQQQVINSVSKPAIFFQATVSGSIGSTPIGGKPLGDGIVIYPNSQDELPKFRVVKGFNPVNCFEYELEVFSYDIDSRWEILALGANAELAREQAGFLQV